MLKSLEFDFCGLLAFSVVNKFTLSAGDATTAFGVMQRALTMSSILLPEQLEDVAIMERKKQGVLLTNSTGTGKISRQQRTCKKELYNRFKNFHRTKETLALEDKIKNISKEISQRRKLKRWQRHSTESPTNSKTPTAIKFSATTTALTM